MFITAWVNITWLGGKEVGSEWKWDNGDLLDMTKFEPGQPDGTGNCLIMLTNLKFDDASCSYPYAKYVCEKSLE